MAGVHDHGRCPGSIGRRATPMSGSDDAEATMADDALDDDCTCAPGCVHGAEVGVGLACDPDCPVHAGAG
ncbi:MAG: hypothetical protein ACRDV0_04635 [Acidimicrobiales bacterium]